ncbi:ParA family protein [Sulfitobacter faviae]|uniref:ParA family protein n=1 Tax=Sulfitobacter faviae TaxID=1775881 RepID=UPI00245575E1|nr:ParA family protein [Sulfitobacter faviae]
MVAVANFKGGVGKTSTAAHLAMSAALDGYRVLVIDLDSQGSMTSIFGARLKMNGKPSFRFSRATMPTIYRGRTEPVSPAAKPRSRWMMRLAMHAKSPQMI